MGRVPFRANTHDLRPNAAPCTAPAAPHLRTDQPTEATFMLLSTTDSIEGRRVVQYLGVVTGEAIIGVHIFRDLFAGIRDIVGGRAGGYQNALRDAREAAFADLEATAAGLGANAVVAIDVDYEVLGKENGMLMVSVNGTAVRLE